MASRAEQKAAARAAREQAAARVRGQQRRRSQLTMLGGVVAVVIAAVVVVIIVSSSGNGGKITGQVPNPNGDEQYYTAPQAKVDANTLLDGIPQSGNVLGNPSAPVTITEYGDLVCSTCDAFAVTSEPLLIAQDVRTGKVKLIFRAAETSSAYANGSEFVTTQVAARSAGLQDREWDFLIILYDEQPHLIKGQSAELESYVTTAYLKNRAQQIPGINLVKWQANLFNPTLIQDVKTDITTGDQLGVDSTPTVFVSGPKGTIEWDKGSDTLPATNTAIAQLNALVKQVS
jgi:protein-disulfide isomerase